jgi:hypothetical protein
MNARVEPLRAGRVKLADALRILAADALESAKSDKSAPAADVAQQLHLTVVRACARLARVAPGR